MNTAHLPIMELRFSRQLALVLGCAHLGALLVLAILPLTLWLQTGGAVLLLLSAVHAFRRHVFRRGRNAVVALHFTDREQLGIRMYDGTWRSGQVLGSSTVGTTLTVLNIALEGRRLPVHVILPADSLAADDFRRLRVWLRWGPRPPTEEPITP